MTQTERATIALLRRREAHKAERAYLAAKRDHKASQALYRSWVVAKARLAQAEAAL